MSRPHETDSSSPAPSARIRGWLEGNHPPFEPTDDILLPGFDPLLQKAEKLADRVSAMQPCGEKRSQIFL